MSAITAVVLAGGPQDDISLRTAGAPNKAFALVGGKALVARTLEALRAAQDVGRIIAVAPQSARDNQALHLADDIRDDGAKIRESLRNGLAGLDPDELVLISTSDLPILTARSVDDFVARARAADADVGYGCLEKRTHVARFPGVPHTWARFRDGTFCGGGLMAMKPRALPAMDRVIERLGQARKNPLHLASLLGWDIVLAFALGQLTIAAAEARASRILNASARAIASPYAETAVNVDRVSDLALAEGLISTG